jgi:hypothetical protein
MDATSHYKSRIENGQRTLRRKEADEKREWRRVFFSTVDSKDPSEATFQQLVKMVMAPHHGPNAVWEGVAPDKTAGVWRFDEEKAKGASKPFHEEGALALGEKEDGSSAPVSRVASTAARPEGAQAPVSNAGS